MRHVVKATCSRDVSHSSKLSLKCNADSEIIKDHESEQILEQRREHQKYSIKVAAWKRIVVTAGWDNKVLLYHANGDFSSLGPPVATTSLSTNPEAITFVEHPGSDRPILLITRRDSTSLYYYSLELKLLGSQNLAPHSNSWICKINLGIVLSPRFEGASHS